MTRSRCTCEANSKTYLNTEVSHSCCHHSQLIRTLGPLSMQQMAYLHTPLLCYVMWPIHQTCNSVKDCSPFWTISPMQENEDINHSFRNSMPCVSTSWSRFQRPFPCLHNSFFLLMPWGTGKVTLICMFPCFAACLGYPSIHLSPSTCRYLLWDAFGFSQLNWLLYRLHTAVLWPRSMVQLGYVNHRPCLKHSWIIPFLPQILLRLSSRSCSPWCLLCQHPVIHWH